MTGRPCRCGADERKPRPAGTTRPGSLGIPAAWTTAGAALRAPSGARAGYDGRGTAAGQCRRGSAGGPPHPDGLTEPDATAASRQKRPRVVPGHSAWANSAASLYKDPLVQYRASTAMLAGASAAFLN